MDVIRSTKDGFREDPVKICCLRCGYTWSTRTKKGVCSCPNCRYPNNTEKAIARAGIGENNGV